MFVTGVELFEVNVSFCHVPILTVVAVPFEVSDEDLFELADVKVLPSVVMVGFLEPVVVTPISLVELSEVVKAVKVSFDCETIDADDILIVDLGILVSAITKCIVKDPDFLVDESTTNLEKGVMLWGNVFKVVIGPVVVMALFEK